MKTYIRVAKRGGEITGLPELRKMVKEDRLHLILVRMECCRFLAPSQDVEHIIEALEKQYPEDEGVRSMHLDASEMIEFLRTGIIVRSQGC